jgi:cation diffusion facilitator family transporter
LHRYKETKRVTLIGGVLDLALGVLKIVVGKLSWSQSLVADGVHSLSDLVTDVLVIWAAREASRAPDADHPYGHERIETVATVALGMLLVTVAAAIALDAVEDLYSGLMLKTPTYWALVVACVSVFSKELIYQYTRLVADQIGSELLRSNAWHSRSDALSSIVVIVGVGGSMLGVSWLDAVAAVVVALMIVYVAAGMIWNSARELIDTGVDAEELDAIRAAAKKIEGVTDIHDLRTRRMGSNVLVDGHVLVDSKISVSEGHRIGDAVYLSLKSGFDNITDITIHIDSEDDTAYRKSSHLPLRSEVTRTLRERWRDVQGAHDIERIVLHYVDGMIQIEAWAPLENFESIEQAGEFARELRAACSRDAQIQSVDVLFC